MPARTAPARTGPQTAHTICAATKVENQRPKSLLCTLSAETVARAAATGLDYVALLRELDATCADGVTDAPAPGP